MTKRPYKKRVTSVRGTNLKAVPRFVVYVTFPNSTKEYSYWCDLPDVHQGSIVIANGTEVIVRRTATHDDRASKWVTSRSAFDTLRRREEVLRQLRQIESREAEMARFKKLKSPEARKLLKELESL